tara:strand:+ start:209 stop:1114 length:906 start_codon:yes stop_codon:yes gene_type:complete
VQNNIESDLEFAAQLCDKNKLALKELQKNYSDSFIYVSKKLAKQSKDYNDGWIYQTLKKVNVFITDDIMDAYLWLVNYIAKKCCYYNGDKNARLTTYIHFILGAKYKQVRASWLIHKYGDIRYVPSCITKLSKNHENVFRLLKRYQDKGIAKQNSNFSNEDFEQLSYSIEKTLIKEGKIDLIYPPFMTELDDNIPQPSLEKPLALINKFKQLTDQLDDLDYELFRMKYWDEYSVREIIEYYQSNNRMNELHEVGLSTSRKIYYRLDQISINILGKVFNQSVKQKNKALKILTTELRRYFDE